MSYIDRRIRGLFYFQGSLPECFALGVKGFQTFSGWRMPWSGPPFLQGGAQQGCRSYSSACVKTFLNPVFCLRALSWRAPPHKKQHELHDRSFRRPSSDSGRNDESESLRRRYWMPPRLPKTNAARHGCPHFLAALQGMEG